MTATRARYSWFLALLFAAPAWGQTPGWNLSDTGAGNAAWMQAPPAPAGDYFSSSEFESVQSGGNDEDFNMTLTFDGIILGRSGLKSKVIGLDEFGNPALYTEDIDVGAQIGPRFSVVMGGRLTGLEFSFFGFNDFSKHDQIGDDGTIPLFFNGVPANLNQSYDVYYRSKLSSAELMFWSPVANTCRFGIGVRGVGLSEDFNFLHDDAGTVAGFWSDTNTDLVGLQLGGGIPLYRHPHFYIDATAKTGVYHHRTDLQAISQNAQLRAHEIDATPVTELNVGGEYHVGKHVSFRGGYMALWLHDVALGPNQNDSWDVINGTGEFDMATALFQGGYFGFQVRW